MEKLNAQTDFRRLFNQLDSYIKSGQPVFSREDIQAVENHLKERTLNIIEKFSSLLREGQYKKAEKMLSWSPAGDGYGIENQYLDFSKAVNMKEGKDIGYILYLLDTINKIK